MLKKLFYLWLVFVVLLPVPAGAQSVVTLAEMQVDLWPEYDRPSMLVIYHVRLPDTVSLPVDVTLRIPAAVGEPNAVAVRQQDGTLLNAAYAQSTQGLWSEITITATLPQIQLEYYDPQLVKDGSQRHFEFTWVSDYAVEAFSIQVQQPLGARNLSVEPNLGSPLPGSDGLTYYAMQIGALRAGSEIAVQLDYEKDGDTLSREGFQVESVSPVNTNTSGRVNLSSVLPWILGVIGVLLLVGGGFWYWQSGIERVRSRPRKRSKRSRSAVIRPLPGANPDDKTVYCHACGKRAGPGDRFCRSCGANLRAD